MGQNQGRGMDMTEPRYLLFVGDEYYPSRGAGDFIASYATLEEAKEAGAARITSERVGRWAQVALFDGDALHELCEFDDGLVWEPPIVHNEASAALWAD